MADTAGPDVGLFPLSYNLAEVGRSILVGKELRKRGIHPIFFSHGGTYEYLIEQFGFDLITIKPTYTDDIINNIIQTNRKEKSGIPYHIDSLREFIHHEAEAFINSSIQTVVSFVNFPCTLSSKIAKIFHIDVSPGPGRFHYSIPDNYETNLTRLIPQRIKVPIFNFFFYKWGKHIRKPFNSIAREHGLPPFSNMFNLIHGDYTLVTNFPEFINIFPHQQLFPKDAYVGIILLEELFSEIFPNQEKTMITQDIRSHFDTDRKKIVLTMGSSGNRSLFTKLLKALNETPYQIIALYGHILDENNLPSLSDHILLKKFIPSLADLHRQADVSIIHGGQGTVYTAAYAGKPMIGIPMQFEQHLHLEKIVGFGAGCMLSKRFFDKKRFLSTLHYLFSNYDTYNQSAKKLSEILPPPNGAENAAKRIHKFLNQRKTR